MGSCDFPLEQIRQQWDQNLSIQIEMQPLFCLTQTTKLPVEEGRIKVR